MNRQNVNYQKELDKLLSDLEQKGEKKTLLLHSCCAPCSSYVLEYLSRYFYITVFYYNPNIYPPEEYDTRVKSDACFAAGAGGGGRLRAGAFF